MVKRKMSEAQREAAAENLAKARAAKKPATYKNIASNVLALDDDHGLSVVSVKQYIKASKDKISDLRKAKARNERGATAKLVSIQAYVRGLNSYLRDGMYPYDFYGEDEEHPVYHQTTAPAYDDEGFRK
jgi:UDP-N-acetylenolpyruvoylglucosamine reductase